MRTMISNKDNKKQLEQVQEDLHLTIKELGDVYEELSILYHLSQTFAGLTIDQVCSTLLDEIQTMLGVKTAAIMLLDEDNDELYTAISTGGWPSEMAFKKGDNIAWNALKKNKPQIFSNIKNSRYKNTMQKLDVVLVCPLIGKKKIMGIIVSGKKTSGQDFYSSDIKFLMAITSQAALAIETAALYTDMENFFFGTVMAFIKAIESRSHWTSGHSERVTKYSLAIAKKMGLGKDFKEKLKICALLHDIGKIATPVALLDKRSALTRDELIEIEQHPLTGSVILGDLKPFRDIIDGIKYHHEKWNGKGVHEKLKGEAIPVMARIIAVADAFDAMTSDRPYRKKINLYKAIEEIEINSGEQFDPNVVSCFLKIKDSLLF